MQDDWRALAHNNLILFGTLLLCCGYARKKIERLVAMPVRVHYRIVRVQMISGLHAKIRCVVLASFPVGQGFLPQFFPACSA